MERIQKTITEKLLDKLPSDLEYIDPQWLGGFGIPGFLVERIKFELHKNLHDSIVPPKTDWADMDAKPVRAAWIRYFEAIEAETRLPSSFARSVIEPAVGDVLNILTEPRKYLPDYLFGKDKTLDYREASERAETIVVYTHFGQHLPNYMRRKQLDFIDRERFSSFISQLDEKLTAQYSPINWAQLLAPLFELNDHLVNSELLVRFFRDKNRPKLASLFERSDGAVNQTQFIEMLSAPVFDHDSESEITPPGTPAAASPAMPPETAASEQQQRDTESDEQPGPAKSESATKSAPASEPVSDKVSETSDISEPVPSESISDVEPDTSQDDMHPSKPGSGKKTDQPARDAVSNADKNNGSEPELSSESDYASVQENIEPADIENEPPITRMTEPSQDASAETVKSGTEAQLKSKSDPAKEPAPLWQQFRQADDPEAHRTEESAPQKVVEKPASKADLSGVKPLFLSKPEQEADPVPLPKHERQAGYDEDRPLVDRFKKDEPAEADPSVNATEETAADTAVSSGASSAENLPMWKRFISAATSVKIPELGKGGQEKPLAERISHSDEEDDYELDIDISNPLRIDEIKKTLDDKKKYYIKRFFKDDQAAFNTVIRDLAEMETWDEAGPYITKNVFKKNKIDPYSDEAVNFIDRLQSYFTSHIKK